MTDNAFQAAMRRRLLAREGEAEAAWRGALSSTGMSDRAISEMLQRVGRELTWMLWNIAIEEADGRG